MPHPPPDFVFVDDNRKPFRLRAWYGQAWLFYWHAEGHWVSLRKVHDSEIPAFQARSLPASDQALYEANVPFLR